MFGSIYQNLDAIDLFDRYLTYYMLCFMIILGGISNIHDLALFPNISSMPQHPVMY